MRGNKISTVATVRSFDSSAAIGRDGLPVLSYYGNGHLRVLHCGKRACSRGNTITTVDGHPNVGYWSSIAIGSDKRPVVSYGDQRSLPNGHLRLLHCGNRACTAANTSTAVAGISPSCLVMGRDGLPLLAYLDPRNGELVLLHCGNRACTTGNIRTRLSVTPDDFSLTLGRHGLPLVGYTGDAGLELLHCGNRMCSSGTSTRNLDTGQGHGIRKPAIAIGADGRPVLSYLWGSALKVLRCGNRTCSSGNTGYLVDRSSPITMGTNPALTIGADRLPLVSYVVAPRSPRSHQYKLRVLHCGSISCQPHR